MEPDGAETGPMKQIVIEAIEKCTDPDLLDLIYKILIMNA